ncbi:MAG: PilZ domain-containing protein [Candidatus Eremiobacteraeota bacterium]|nr:PilZ domain-containing protein [Candidatus Eremiobacteraeota bacterium]MCW5868700.1 PilZ domain-containing protein [Candidatus Eremiobacteraeota bacterium]
MVARQASKRLGELFSLVKAVLLGRPNISLDNRRQAARLRLRVPILCKLGDEEVDGELLDISSTGMRILLKTFVEPDETIRVSAPDQSGLVGRQRLICRVAWVRPRRPEYEVGLEYNDSDENLAHSWIQLALRHLDPEQVKRRSRRIPANLFVQVWDSHNISLGRGICVNISTGGCLLQMERHIAREEVVKLGLGPSDLEASIFLSGRVLNHIPSPEFGQFLHHVQFFPGENRNHSRLRSLMLTLLQELEQEALISEDPEVDLADEEEESLFTRLSRVNPPPPPPRPPEPAPEPHYTPGPDQLQFTPGAPLPLGAPVEFGVARKAQTPPPEPGEPGAEPMLSDRIGRQGPLHTRNYELRSTSLWAARTLPVSARRRTQPQDSQHFSEPDSKDEETPPLDRDYLS